MMSISEIFSVAPAYGIVYLVLAFILGAVFGSFLNVVIIRTPRKESIIGNHNGGSHCMSCNHKLGVLDLFPIFSYIFLGGKCRYCKAKISPRYWIVELSTALLFTLAFVAFGISYKLIIAFILISALIVASGIDIDTMEIPYGASLIVALLGATETIVSIFTKEMPWYDHLIGVAVIAVPFAVLALFGAMGGGDVQLMAAAGLLLGWQIVPAAGIGIVLGAIGGGISMLSVPKGTKKLVSEKSNEIANEWYKKQKENGIAVIENKTDAIYGSIFDGKADIEAECVDAKLWTGKPDIDELNGMLDAELSGITKYAVSMVFDSEGVKTVSCKKQIVFGPYLSVGILTAYMFGKAIIDWYLGLM